MGTCRALKDQKFDPILQTTCREKNRVEIQEHLLRASESGVGEYSDLYRRLSYHRDSLQEIMFFHVDSGKLFLSFESLP